MYLEVALNLPIDKTFTYAASPELAAGLSVGQRVLVPFGKRKLTGYVVTLTKEKPSGYAVKEILDVLDEKPVFDHQMLKLTQWIATYYFCGWGEVLEAALPAGFSINSRSMVRFLQDSLELAQTAPLQWELLKIIKDAGVLTATKLSRLFGKKSFYAALNGLAQKGLCEVETQFLQAPLKPKKVKVVSLAKPKQEILAHPLTLRQKSLVEILAAHKQMTPEELAEKAGTGQSPIQSLLQKGFFIKGDKEVNRQPGPGAVFERSFPLSLTTAQAEALNSIIDCLNQNKFAAFLLHGVTGSGKTEVYLQAINQVLNKGKSAIILVPEISLTPQTVERFKSRFQSQIAIFHSRLSAGERYDEWQRMHQGQANICIGARSAIFAPLKNLGLIVVDEEHESSYKQYEPDPRYNARDVAVMRAKHSEAAVVLGSATPSLESYYNSKIGKYIYLHLAQRIDNRSLPEVEIVDMREELKAKSYSIFSQMLKNSIAQKLNQKEQIMIFLNRRGFSPFIQCRQCGFVLKCANCDITLTYHLQDKSLRCHYCNYSRVGLKECPNCRGVNIGYFGTGTQRVEEELQKLFLQARICRMDLDTTTKKHSHETILNSFKSGQIDILVGTQMIAKGLDFPNVTLVGVISADVGLNLPDFRAAERTFSLLTQVAGRCGRGPEAGEVIIQTYNPADYSILAAQTHDYQAFYSKEILFRKELNYPPFSRLVNITLKGKVEQEVKRSIEEIGFSIREQGVDPSIIVLGPAPCALPKIKQEYRWQILLKGKDTKRMRELVRKSLERVSRKQGVSIDVDPAGML